MARPQKKGLDWFPMAVNWTERRGQRFVFARYGGNGVFVLLEILKQIYQFEGYYCNWSDEDGELLSLNLGQSTFTKEMICSVVDTAVEYGVFDKSMYDTFGVLTSEEIQTNYWNVAVRRKNVVPIDERYRLIEIDAPQEQNRHSTIVSADINPVSADINEFLQGKSIVENSIVEKRNMPRHIVSAESAGNEFQTEDGVVRPSIDKSAVERIFFFNGADNPTAEVERFCDNYDAQGWKRNGQPITNVLPLARNWKFRRKSTNLPSEFLVFWSEACRECEDISLHYNEVSKAETGDSVLLVHLTTGLNKAIERNAGVVRPIFARHFKGKEWRVRLTD